MRLRALSWLSMSLLLSWIAGGCGTDAAGPFASGGQAGSKAGSSGSGGSGSPATAGAENGVAGDDDPSDGRGQTGGATTSTPENDVGTDASTAGSAGSSRPEPEGGAGGTPILDSGLGGNPPAPSLPTTWLKTPAGKIPNTTQDPSAIGVPQSQWQKGLVSPTMNDGTQMNQPAVINGYLLLSGNEKFDFWDIANPAKPVRLSTFLTPNRCATCGQKKEGEAESQQVSFARYGNSIYEVTIGGVGVNIWDITDASKPVHLKAVGLQGIKYDDFTGAVWGVAWQGDTIYVGSTDQGLDILDAKDPKNVQFVKRLPTNKIGGFSAGPLFPVGNVLVITTPKNAAGISTMDITDPRNPTLMHSLKAPADSYIGSFYRHYAAFVRPLRLWDVLTDPYNIGSPDRPYAMMSPDIEKVEYPSFADDFVFLGHTRDQKAGATKVDISDLKHMVVKNRVWGRVTADANDDQFTIQIGSMLVMCDDEAPYHGCVLGAHATTPDSKPPVVDTVIPKDKSTVAVTSRVGITFSDNIEIATVHGDSFIVRPVGGQPVTGKWGMQVNGIINFYPDAPFKPKTNYEVVLPKGGLTDFVGNGIAAEFRSTFTTQ